MEIEFYNNLFQTEKSLELNFIIIVINWKYSNCDFEKKKDK